MNYSPNIRKEVTGSEDSFRMSLGSQVLFSFEGANWRQLERVRQYLLNFVSSLKTKISP